MRALVFAGLAGSLLGCAPPPGEGQLDPGDASTSLPTVDTVDPSTGSASSSVATEGSGESGDGGSTTDPSGSSSDEGTDTGDPPAACPEDDVFPEPDWAEGDPIDFGLDPAALEEAAAYAGENESRCLLVVRHGHLVFERYWHDTTEDTRPRTYSLAKSHTASLVGIAIAQGILGSVDDPLGDYLPELVGTPKQNITIFDLLTMTSAVYGGVLDDYVLLTFAGDQSQRALDAEPNGPVGAAWQYSNTGVQLLEPLLRSATGLDVEEYAAQNLWGPIGMDAEWDHDAEGHALTYQNVLASCRDHARFGHLYLRRGCWDGERVLDEDFVDAATTTSQDLNRGYGYLFWVTGQEPTLESVSFDEIEGGLHPFAPEGTFAARGLGGQMIEIIPELDMVVVRTGFAPQDAPGAWSDPLGLVQELLSGSGEDVPGVTLEMILDGVTD